MPFWPLDGHENTTKSVSIWTHKFIHWNRLHLHVSSTSCWPGSRLQRAPMLPLGHQIQFTWNNIKSHWNIDWKLILWLYTVLCCSISIFFPRFRFKLTFLVAFLYLLWIFRYATRSIINFGTWFHITFLHWRSFWNFTALRPRS